MKCTLPLFLGFMAAILPLPVVAAENVHLSIDASKSGARIDRNLFGQFAENLGHGLYEGIWVGPDSPIPNTRGIRNDVVSALRELKVPNVRWPGGCFADEYHWKDGIGPREKRPSMYNSHWGGVVENNHFGTHEFLNLCEMLGIEFPLFAFSHCRDVVAAVSRAGGFGVLGATGHTASSVHTELKWIDDHVDGKPYGIDLLFPENMATAGEVGVTYNSLKTRIPQEHRDFAAGLLRLVVEEIAAVPQIDLFDV